MQHHAIGTATGKIFVSVGAKKSIVTVLHNGERFTARVLNDFVSDALRRIMQEKNIPGNASWDGEILSYRPPTSPRKKIIPSSCDPFDLTTAYVLVGTNNRWSK